MSEIDLSVGVMTSDFLIGVDSFARDHVRRYQEFFAAVVAERGFPLHTASLWNALHFGWSLGDHKYLGAFEVTAAADGQPIPVGSFVEVATGQRILWAEVVYKEGRDPRIDPLGIVEPGASGARLGLARAREAAEVAEGLILDFEAFGPGLNETTEVAFARARRKGWLTADRHKEVRVRYTADQAGIDDLALFARHIMATYGDHLFDHLLLDYGRAVSSDDRWQLLLASLATVDELAAGAPNLRTFGLYHLDEASYQADLSRSGDHPLSGGTIRSIATGVIDPGPDRPARLAGWAGPRSASYRSVGALVREQFARHGLDPAEQALLNGPGYARLVLEANAEIAERIGPRGLIDGRVHARLDDEWQGGGVWRTVRYDGSAPVEARYGPLIALGLGYASTSGAVGIAAPTEVLEPEAAERASDRTWRVPLRYIDLFYGDLPLATEAIAMLPTEATRLIVDLRDGLGFAERKTHPLDRQRRLVRGIAWPATFMAGTIIGYSVGHGGALISLHSDPLTPPVVIEGRTHLFAFDEAVFRRDLRLDPLPPAALARARTLTDQINEVFRRRGRVTNDGSRALRTEEIIGAILGPEATSEASLPILLRLQAGDFEFRSPEYVWQAAISRRTSPRERTRILAARERGGGYERLLAPRMVPMHLRQYRLRHPGAEKIRTYSAKRVQYHMEHQLPPALPPGASWVEPYQLGPREPVDPANLIWDALTPPVAEGPSPRGDPSGPR